MICPRCGSAKTIFVDGKPPHLAQEKCADCSRHLRWLPRSEAVARGFDCGQKSPTSSDGGQSESFSAGNELIRPADSNNCPF
jgi:hypothetical protein